MLLFYSWQIWSYCEHWIHTYIRTFFLYLEILSDLITQVAFLKYTVQTYQLTFLTLLRSGPPAKKSARPNVLLLEGFPWLLPLTSSQIFSWGSTKVWVELLQDLSSITTALTLTSRVVLTSWYDDIMTSWHPDILTSWHLDIMTSWHTMLSLFLPVSRDVSSLTTALTLTSSVRTVDWWPTAGLPHNRYTKHSFVCVYLDD